LALKLIRSESLEKRINALGEINEMLQQTRVKERCDENPQELEEIKKDPTAQQPTHFLTEL